MPKRRTARQTAASRANLAIARKARKPMNKKQALSNARTVLRVRNSYSKASPNPQFVAKVGKAQKFLKHHGNSSENASATKGIRGGGLKDIHGKKVKGHRRVRGPGKGH